MLDLEALGDRIEPLAGEHVVTLGALLVEPDADRVAREDPRRRGCLRGSRVDELQHFGGRADGEVEGERDLARQLLRREEL